MRATLASAAHVHAVDMLDEVAVEAAFERIGAFDYLTVTAVADETALMAPGVVGSGVWSEAERENLERWARDGGLPVGRLGTPDDLAQAYLALLGNRYMSGSVVGVDGGLLLT